MDSNEQILLAQRPNLGSLPSLPDLWTKADDWTGVTSTAQRKKLQNRLNQRAWRRRKNLTKEDSRDAVPGAWQNSAPSLYSREHEIDSVGAGLLLPVRPDEASTLKAFFQQAYTEYALKSLRLSTLPFLIRINVLDALARNAALLNISSIGLCNVDLISLFNLPGPSPPEDSYGCYPRTLQPTSLQRSVTHHPWIDLLPFAALRDNMLRYMALGLLSDDELCDDILGVRDDTLSGSAAMIVWGEPSDWNAWEINAAFLRKWGLLVQGCPEIIVSTNKWRARRGEKAIVYRE
ncbi:unnamed protein product [Clonostachys byssicola]|uniref:Uncharacterized protein n=1 Tax=Clonostachys byssicola TaxID=160290 RepID=A0A9N9UB53_9HYPO|nr:unnamed protein product [Clonostachys byssicola]